MQLIFTLLITLAFFSNSLANASLILVSKEEETNLPENTFTDKYYYLYEAGSINLDVVNCHPSITRYAISVSSDYKTILLNDGTVLEMQDKNPLYRYYPWHLEEDVSDEEFIKKKIDYWIANNIPLLFRLGINKEGYLTIFLGEKKGQSTSIPAGIAFQLPSFENDIDLKIANIEYLGSRYDSHFFKIELNDGFTIRTDFYNKTPGFEIGDSVYLAYITTWIDNEAWVSAPVLFSESNLAICELPK